MANEIVVDLRGVDPAQGGGMPLTRIKPDLYLLKVDKLAPRTTNAGQNSVRLDVSVAQGSEAGARMQDEFLLDATEKGSRFGAQRFAAFLQACGVTIRQDVLKFDGDRLVGRLIVGDVQDSQMAESKEKNADGTPKYPSRTISRPQAYYNPKALPPEIASRMGVAPAAVPAAPAAAPQEAPQAAAATPVPTAPITTAPQATPAGQNGVGEPTTIGIAQVAQETDDLFA